MRCSELAKLIAAKPQRSRFVILGATRDEMRRSGSREGTMSSSLHNSYPGVGRTLMSLSVGEAHKRAFETNQSIRPELLPHDSNQFLRSITKNLVENRVRQAFARIQADFAGVFANLKANDLLESDAKPRFTGLVYPWLNGLKIPVLLVLRRHSTSMTASAWA